MQKQSRRLACRPGSVDESVFQLLTHNTAHLSDDPRLQITVSAKPETTGVVDVRTAMLGRNLNAGKGERNFCQGVAFLNPTTTIATPTRQAPV